MEIKRKGKMKGFYSVKVIEGGIVKDEGRVDNMLLDRFFDYVNSVERPRFTSATLYCGTGTDPVLPSQTSLSNQVTLTSGTFPTASPAVTLGALIEGDTKVYAKNDYEFLFDVGQVVGNISELGAQLLNDSGRIHSRALITDEQGQPTTITVTSNDRLIVSYTLEYYGDAADTVSTVMVDDDGQMISTEIVARWGTLVSIEDYSRLHSELHLYDGDIQSIGLQPSGAKDTQSSTSKAFSVSGGKEAVFIVPTDKANFAGGISAMALETALYYTNWPTQMRITPPLNKTSDKTLTITTRQEFSRA